MMRKLYLALIVIVVILFGLIYFSVSGVQTVSTDKKVYSSGEEVKIHWSDFSLEWCSCSNKGVAVLRQEITGWERVQYELYGFGIACVDGQMTGLGMPCDASSCSFPKLNSKSGVFSWNSKIYKRNGTVNSCLRTFRNEKTNSTEVINGTMNNYESKNALSGKYKIIFGNAEKIMEIK